MQNKRFEGKIQGKFWDGTGRREVPKTREDTQTVACRIDRAILDGRGQVLPIFRPGSSSQEAGRLPSVLAHLSGLRLRLPPMYEDTIEKYEAKYERKWDNRTTIPICILNSRYVPVSKRAYDYEWLLSASEAERKAAQVVVTTKGLRRRIYEVVEDFSHSLRQIEHIKSEYFDEVNDLETLRSRLQDRQRREAAGLLTLSERQIESDRLTSLQVGRRLAEIETILYDRSARESRLHAYVRRSNLELYNLARSLSNFSASIGRMEVVNKTAVSSYLEGLVSELYFFSSKEVRPGRIQAQRRLRWLLNNLEESSATRIQNGIEASAESLLKSAIVLSGWADSLSQIEREKAADIGMLAATGAYP